MSSTRISEAVLHKTFSEEKAIVEPKSLFVLVLLNK